MGTGWRVMGALGYFCPTPRKGGIRGVSRKQVNLQVLDQNIYTGDATGRLLFNMLGAIAQFEKEIRAERQLDGIQKAKGEACTSAGKRN